ncbi:hypothetical protein Syun_029705 [Stephania yunnanensis]|uniref:Uncharacterized protein n=1 Tax=Stephania yunnanensis TaxID=152371 RepID=A0AAP0E645_9MAGN
MKNSPKVVLTNHALKELVPCHIPDRGCDLFQRGKLVILSKHKLKTLKVGMRPKWKGNMKVEEIDKERTLKIQNGKGPVLMLSRQNLKRANLAPNGAPSLPLGRIWPRVLTVSGVAPRPPPSRVFYGSGGPSSIGSHHCSSPMMATADCVTFTGDAVVAPPLSAGPRAPRRTTNRPSRAPGIPLWPSGTSLAKSGILNLQDPGLCWVDSSFSGVP